MAGLLILICIALAILLTLLTVMLVREMRRPPRHTTAYALARGMPCDPGELGFLFEEWLLDRPNSVQLAVWDIRNPHNQSDHRKSLTAVFVHGWGHSRIDVLPRMPLFAEFCHRIVVYDLRGHGESTGKSNLGHGEDDDLLVLLERLEDDRIILVGHSMGAVIAMHAAVKTRSNRISAVIAYGAYCEFHTSLKGRLRVAGYPARPLTDLALLVQHLFGITPLNLHERDVGQLRCPLCLFHGSEDRVAPIEHGRRLACFPDATLHEVSGGSHTDLHAIDAERHDALVRDFMQRVLAAESDVALSKVETGFSE